MNGQCNLLIIRHAETDMAGTFCGHSNPAVNARGLTQIEDLLQEIKTNVVDAVFSSDLRRAVTTAEAIAELFNVQSTQMSTLREIAFGEWEGLTWSSIEARDPAYARSWVDAYPTLCAPGGEAFDRFKTRVLAVVDYLHRLPVQRIAIVTHAGVMRVILTERCGVSDQEAWAMTKPYCSFFEYPAPLGQAASA